MGCWGYGPFDNDTAADMMAVLAREAYAVVSAKTDDRAQDHYEEARAAAQLLLVSHATDILGGPGLDDPLKALARMRRDVDWLSGFRQPKKIAAAVEAELMALQRVRAACKGCRRDKDAECALGAIIAEALKTKVPRAAAWGMVRTKHRRRATKRKKALPVRGKRHRLRKKKRR